jgi:opacity protein-like surface antigen
VRRRGRALAAAVALLTLPAVAAAQARPGKGSVEVAGGITYVGGYSFDERTAEQTANTGSTGAPFDFFTTDSEIKPVVGYRVRLGYFLSPSLSIEGGLRFAKPVYEVRITDDFENAPDSTAEEDLSQYLFDGSLVYHFGSGSGSRAAPFVYGGAGYLRELHEGETLVEEGVEYHAGGGIKVWLGSGRFAIRGDVGVSFRDGGFDLEDKSRVVPEAGASLVWVF